jgi:methionyl-tRNA formyltransferase
VVVFAGETVFAAALGSPLLASDAAIAGLVISTRTTGSLRRIRKVAGKTFPGYFVYRSLVQAAGLGHRLFHRLTVPDLARRRGLPPIKTAAIATDPALLALLPADLGVALNFDQIIPGDMLIKFTHGVLNVHAGRLPHDKGISPALWAFARGDAEVWVSMYVMGEGIDTGRVVRQFAVAVRPGESFAAFYLRLCTEAGGQLPQVVASIAAGTAPTVVESTAGEGTYHGWPDDEVRAGLRANKRHLMNVAGLARLVAGLPRPRRARV